MTKQNKNTLVYIFLGLLVVTLLNACGQSSSSDPGVVKSSTCPAGRTCVGLQWDPVTTDLQGNPVVVTGYKVYYGNASRVYTTNVDVGNTTTATIEDLTPGIYYFAVTAYIRNPSANELESGYSNEVNIGGRQGLTEMGLSPEISITVK